MHKKNCAHIWTTVIIFNIFEIMFHVIFPSGIRGHLHLINVVSSYCSHTCVAAKTKTLTEKRFRDKSFFETKTGYNMTETYQDYFRDSLKHHKHLAWFTLGRLFLFSCGSFANQYVILRQTYCFLFEDLPKLSSGIRWIWMHELSHSITPTISIAFAYQNMITKKYFTEFKYWIHWLIWFKRIINEAFVCYLKGNLFGL